jgi:hypothetical protein
MTPDETGWKAGEVIHELQAHLEPADVQDADAPVRRCRRYLDKRRRLDYQAALARDLPIGSGEIESASLFMPRGYIVQQRLKRPGAG